MSVERRIDKVKLKRLIVKKLHNLYDYDIKFFENINIWFGKNGCGKTTLLNIINSIISGEVYKLKRYKFESIQLQFKKNKKSKMIDIDITYDKDVLQLSYDKGEKQSLEIDAIELDDEYTNIRREEKEKELYFRKYEILNTIKENFNIVYLPLSREYLGIDYEKFYRRYRINRRERGLRVGHTYLDTALEQALFLVEKEYANINEKINSIESGLKTKIFEVMFSSIRLKTDDKEIPESDMAFIINNFRRIGIYDENLENKMNEFFKEYNKAINKYNKIQKEFDEILENNINDPEKQMDVVNKFVGAKNDLASFNTVKCQIEELRKMFEEYNEEVRKIMSPILMFGEIINEYLKNSAVPKQMIVSLSKIYFRINESIDSIDISELSSGEKQIILLIAYLIFKVLPEEQPIFMVDEPEMSLHLMWQRQWINSIQKINPDIQLIIATHSPEIVDKYRNYMINIIPKIGEIYG